MLREAHADGCLTLDGLPMLIAQAGGSWVDRQRPRAGVMKEAAYWARGSRQQRIVRRDGITTFDAGRFSVIYWFRSYCSSPPTTGAVNNPIR